MAKTKKNLNYLKGIKKTEIEVGNYASVPTYNELNAFMRPSKISPMYLYNSNDSSSDTDNDSSLSLSNESQISDESLYDIEPQDYAVEDPDVAENPDIAENDKNIYNMKCILEKKKLLLIEKNREIKELAKQNGFLNNVLSDYEKIKSHILEEKRKQQSAIKIISKHISQLSKNMNEEDSHIGQLQEDQFTLLEELAKIKMEMNEVMRS
jgi:hypothetical protein